MSEVILSVTSLEKSYDDVKAVAGLDFEMEKGSSENSARKASKGSPEATKSTPSSNSVFDSVFKENIEKLEQEIMQSKAEVQAFKKKVSGVFGEHKEKSAEDNIVASQVEEMLAEGNKTLQEAETSRSRETEEFKKRERALRQRIQQLEDAKIKSPVPSIMALIKYYATWPNVVYPGGLIFLWIVYRWFRRKLQKS